MSRPRRAAAQAAVEAIRIGATDADAGPPAVGEDEDAYVDVPNVGSKRSRKEGLNGLYDDVKDERTKKQKQMDLPCNTITSPHVEQPALFDRLPIELKRLILPYLDRDPYALIALQLSSKSWYLAMTTGRNTDAEWQRRCVKMGAQKRSPGCKTWRESWISMMKNRCMICRKLTTAKLGGIVPTDLSPKWVKTCETCQFSGTHPFRCTSSLAGLDDEDRERLPFKWRKYDNRVWCKDYLKLSVEAIKEERRQERLEDLEDVIAGYEGEDEDTLREAIMLVENKQSRSNLLTKLVETLIELEQPASKDYNKVVNHQLALIKAQSDLEIALVQLQPALEPKWIIPVTRPFIGPQKITGPSTWLQAIACKDVSVADFVHFQLDRKASLEKKPSGVFDRFRSRKQACQSRVLCTGNTLCCDHGLCEFHHGPLCEAIISNLVDKVTSFYEGEEHVREMETARRILLNAQADIGKHDKPAESISKLVHKLIALDDNDDIELAIIMKQLDGVKDWQVHLEVARRCLGTAEDVIWHVNLNDRFKGLHDKGGSGDDFTWRRAISKGRATLSDIAHFELECKQFSTEMQETENDHAFRNPEQKCSTFLLCDTASLDCSHGRCQEHHLEACTEQKAAEKKKKKGKTAKGKKRK